MTAEQINLPASTPFLTIADLAAMLRVDRRTVERWASSGRIPTSARVQLGPRAVRYRREAIEQWIAAGCPGE
jgi:excisionase family DNA binding protein